MLTQERLKEVLNYNPETGVFVWLISPRFNVDSGSIAGTMSSKGYIYIAIDGKSYLAHRLAWLYTYNFWPKHQIDHENHNRSDNRLINLREATNQENHKNSPMRADNTSGITGVYWFKPKGKWCARIMISSKPIHLGYFEDINEAAQARKKAEVKYGFHENHGLKHA